MTLSTAITILGLGPGRWDDLTLQARALLEQAASDNKTVFFRTLIHPIVKPLNQEIPNLRITSFDSFYDEVISWDTLYQRIAQEICTLAEQHPPVLYAVPGHPLIDEASVQQYWYSGPSSRPEYQYCCRPFLPGAGVCSSGT